jgi:hypothetical protein
MLDALIVCAPPAFCTTPESVGYVSALPPPTLSAPVVMVCSPLPLFTIWPRRPSCAVTLTDCAVIVWPPFELRLASCVPPAVTFSAPVAVAIIAPPLRTLPLTLRLAPVPVVVRLVLPPTSTFVTASVPELLKIRLPPTPVVGAAGALSVPTWFAPVRVALPVVLICSALAITRALLPVWVTEAASSDTLPEVRIAAPRFTPF